jgi:hypothetical protein
MDKRISQQFPREKKRYGNRFGKFLPPKGMLVAEYDIAAELGCIMTEGTGVEYFNALMVATKYNPCDGCARWEYKTGPDCKCFQFTHTAFRDAKAVIAKAEKNLAELHTRKRERCYCGLRIRGSVEAHEASEQHQRRLAAKK